MILGKVNHKNEIFDAFIQNETCFLIKSFYSDYKLIDSIDIKSANFVNPFNPTKIVGVGLNYKNHAKEFGFSLPENPIIFLKPLNTLSYNGEKIFYPKIVESLDYEAELAIIIKKKAKNIKKREAYDYILGYSCANDITARCIQKKRWAMDEGKGF